ncbi:hypothetical protein IKQ26_07975 [bacterium]|nr:hypothetical protein [bacterium]
MSKKNYIKPLLAAVQISVYLLMSADIVNAEDIVITGNQTNNSAVVANNITTVVGAKMTNNSDVTALSVLANQGSWSNSTIASSINAAVLNQQGNLLNLGTTVTTDFSTYSGSKTENQSNITVTHALLNQGQWINGGTDSSVNASTLNQKGSMLNQGSVVSVDFSTYTGSTTENQGGVTVNHALSNEGNWTNGGTSSSINASTLNQKNSMINQGSIVAGDFSTYTGSTTENQGGVTVTHVLANKGAWTNGTSASSINTPNLNQEGSLLNQGTIIADYITTFTGSYTENQKNITANNVLVNKGNWINSSTDSTITAHTFNQENSLFNRGSVVTNDMNTFLGSTTINEGSIKANNTLTNKGHWENSTVISKIIASNLNQEGSLLNKGSVTANYFTTLAGTTTENRGNVNVTNTLANKGNWTNSTAASKLTVSSLNQENQMLNLGSITATDFANFSGAKTENQGSIKVNNVLSNEGNWINGGTNSSLTASTINQKNKMLNQGSVTTTDFSTYSGSSTQNQGSIRVNNALSNEGNWINEGSDSGLIVSTLNQKNTMLNQGSITATDFTNYAGATTDNQGSVKVNNVLANKGIFRNSTASSSLKASTLNQESSMLNLGSVETTYMTTFAGSNTENQGSVKVNSVLANKGNWTNGGTASSLTAANLNQENTMLNQGSVEATNMTTFAGSNTQNQGSVKVNSVLANKGNWINEGTSSTLTAVNLNQENTMLNQGSVEANNMTMFAGSTIDNQNYVKVNNTLVNKGTWENSTSGSQVIAANLNQESSLLNRGSVLATNMTTFAGSTTDNQNSVVVNNTLSNKGSWTNSNPASTLTVSSLNQENSMINKGSIQATSINTFAGSTTDNQRSINVNNAFVNRGTFTNSTTTSTLTAAALNNEAAADFINYGRVGSSDHHVININNKSGAASFINNGTGKIYATTFKNDSTVENQLGGYIYSDNFINNNTLENNGTVDVIIQFTNPSGASVTNNGAEGEGTLNILRGTNDSAITQGNLTISNGGAFYNNSGGTLNIETTLQNSGLITNSNVINVQNSTNDANLINDYIIRTVSGVVNADTMTTNDNSVMTLTDSQLTLAYQAGDINGAINILGSSNTDLTITGASTNIAGRLNVGSGGTTPVLNLYSGNVTKNAVVGITRGSVVNIDDSAGPGTSSMVIDGGDAWLGDINNISGSFELDGNSVNTGSTSTTAGGRKTYYKQTGGNFTMKNATLTMDDSSLISGGSMFLDGGSRFNSKALGFTVSDLQTAGVINAINGTYETYTPNNNFIIGTTGDGRADFTTDLYARSSGSAKYDKFGSSTSVLSAGGASRHGIINLSDYKIYGDMYGADAPIDKDIMLDIFEYGSVKAGDRIDFTATKKQVATAVGNYGIISRGDGKYSFSLLSYNPKVFRGQVTTLAQYQNQLVISDLLFNHTFVNNGFKGNDILSYNPNAYASSGDLYAPYQYSLKNGGLWAKGYGGYDKLKLTSADVDAGYYGTLVGADFGLKKLKRGWEFLPTAYMGYNGALQRWEGIKAYQNGAQLGFLGTWYKKDFIIGTMAYGGMYNNRINTPRETDDTFGYFMGASAKAAYNWKIKRDFSLQPNLMFSYNFFGKQNWSSSFGQMDMQTGILNGFNIAPGLNFIWEKETFSIYATLQYMLGLNGGVDGQAGNINLPEQKMEGNGYLQYGLGINKKLFSDRFSIYGQAVFRNLARTGIGVQTVVNFKLGKSQKKAKTKKISKQKKQKTKVKAVEKAEEQKE